MYSVHSIVSQNHPRKGKTSDFHAESGNKKLFQFWNQGVLVDMIIISSVVFYELNEALHFFFAYIIQNSIHVTLLYISLTLKNFINSIFKFRF